MELIFKLFVLHLLLMGRVFTEDVDAGDPTLKLHSNREILEKALISTKIAESLRDKFLDSEKLSEERADIMIEFEGGNQKGIRDFHSDTISTRAGVTKGERISSLVSKLRQNADSSQAEVVAWLNSENIPNRPLWISNEIYIEDANSRIVSELAERFGRVSVVREAGKFHSRSTSPVRPAKPATPATTVAGFKPPGQIETSNPAVEEIPQPIQQVNGRCGEIRKGCLGEGVVVAILDDGVLYTHDELTDNFREDFGWYDPSLFTKLPRWVGNQGTHVAGTIVGKTKGLAPKAQWIACQVFKTEGTHEEVYSKACGEWALCPFQNNDTNDWDCSKAPDVIVSGWAIDEWVQQTIRRDFFYGIVEAWNAAGIHSTFAAGDGGYYCTTVNPPAMYDNAFAIGAVDETSTVYYLSARGPVLSGSYDVPVNSNSGAVRKCGKHCPMNFNGQSWSREVCSLTKPDITAPGVNINSSLADSTNSYGSQTGTAMSAAQVAGVLALMVCENNRANGKHNRLKVAEAIDILKSTATTRRINLEEGNNAESGDANNFAKLSHHLCNIALGDTCGFPNNLYGWGEVEACEAVKKVRARKMKAEL